MKPETRDRLIGFAVGVVTVVVTLSILAIFEARSEQRELCMSAEMRDRIRTLALEGYDEAFKQHAIHLFSVYVRNADEMPNRASVGTQNSIRAYVRARELAAKWNPPLCP